MIIDFSWTGGLVFGLYHLDTAVVETDDDEYAFCNAIVLALGFFQISLLFV